MFDVDSFLGECVAAAGESDGPMAVREVLARAVSTGSGMQTALPPSKADLEPLYSSESVTIVKVVWAPAMTLPPHDHRMWAAIGIYGGVEDNVFWRRRDETIVESGGRSIEQSDVLLLGEDVVHSVTNPLTRAYTSAIHIYGGDFMTRPRSMWDPETLEEGPADGNSVRRLFDQANREWAGRSEADR
jgi:predicted metal-dependent enzyme (double-stranded beta helix superfamily)